MAIRPHAVVSGNLDALRVLGNFSHYITKTNFFGYSGYSALILVECGHTECIAFLIEVGADRMSATCELTEYFWIPSTVQNSMKGYDKRVNNLVQFGADVKVTESLVWKGVSDWSIWTRKKSSLA